MWREAEAERGKGPTFGSMCNGGVSTLFVSPNDKREIEQVNV